MMDLHNLLWDVLSDLELAEMLTTRVDLVEPNRWMIYIRHPDRDNSLLQVEIITEQDGGIITSLLTRRGFSRRLTETILDALVENMETEDEQSISSQSSEQQSSQEE